MLLELNGFFACFWWFSCILYEVPAACAAAVVTKRDVLTLDSKNPPAPPLPLTPPHPHPPKVERGERTGEERKIFSNILGRTTSLFCMCTVLSPRSCLRGTPGSRVGGPVSHDWTFPAFKFGRGLLVLVLVEAKSTARQQNFFRSPMPLPNFRDRLWRPGLVKEKSTARQQNVFRSPMPLPNFRDRRRRPGPGQQRASKILVGLPKSRCAHFLRQTQRTPEENFRPWLKFLPNQNKTKIPNSLL